MAPGDEVVCTNIENVCSCNDKLCLPGYLDPVVGQHYIVAKTGTGFCPDCGDTIELMSPVGRERLGCGVPYGWAQKWFRALEYDEDEAVAEAGVTLPVRV